MIMVLLKHFSSCRLQSLLQFFTLLLLIVGATEGLIVTRPFAVRKNVTEPIETNLILLAVKLLSFHVMSLDRLSLV